MGDVKRLANSITCHCWNADRTKVALSPNSNEIHIYAKKGNDYVREHILKEHDQLVTSLDWGAKTNRLVSASQDRNAYVWEFKDNVWKPTLVILRINRAATSVKWSPNENKFAVGSGAKLVSICYFVKDHDWWVSKHIKKHNSTVLDVAWHPGNVLIATACCDFTARVFSAFVKGEDQRPSSTPYGTKLPLGILLKEYPAPAWVKSIRWSPSGNRIAFAAHNSSVTFVDCPDQVQTVNYKELPLEQIEFLSEDSIVGVGHDNNPMLFTNDGGWGYRGKLDVKKAGGASQGAGNRAAFNKFKNMVNTGQTAGVGKLDSKHQNCANCVTPFKVNGDRVESFCTTALDGSIVIWDVQKCAGEAKVKVV